MRGPFSYPRAPALPFKLNQNRRHHIPKQKHTATNRAAHDASLRQRGSLAVWFTDEAVKAWRAEPRTTPGGQPLLGLTLAVPGHATPSRRAATLEVPRPPPGRGGEPLHLPLRSTGLKLCRSGEGLVEKHGRAAWQKASGRTIRARAEAASSRFKQVMGDGLRSRTDPRRATEVDVAVHALNRLLGLGRPNAVRIA